LLLFFCLQNFIVAGCILTLICSWNGSPKGYSDIILGTYVCIIIAPLRTNCLQHRRGRVAEVCRCGQRLWQRPPLVKRAPTITVWGSPTPRALSAGRARTRRAHMPAGWCGPLDRDCAPPVVNKRRGALGLSAWRVLKGRCCL